MQHATCLNVLLLEFTNMTKMWLFMLLSDCHQTLWLCLTRSMCMRKQIRQKLSCACYSNGLPMHCRHVPLSWNDKPLPRQQSLAVLTPVSSFPPQPVVSWHDWNCAIPVSKHNKFAATTPSQYVHHVDHTTTLWNCCLMLCRALLLMEIFGNNHKVQ